MMRLLASVEKCFPRTTPLIVSGLRDTSIVEDEGET